MQRFIINAVAAGEVERLVVVSTEPAGRLSGFGGGCGGERPAATRAHGLLDWLERRETRSADRNTPRREERGATDSAGRREQNCSERINRGAQDHKRSRKRTLLQAARGSKVIIDTHRGERVGTRAAVWPTNAEWRGLSPAGPHGLSFGALATEVGSLNFSHAARGRRHTTPRRLDRREM